LQAANVLERGQGGAREEAVRLLEAGLAAAEQSGAEGYRLRCLAPLAELTGEVSVLQSADELLASARFTPGTAWLHGLEAYLSLARAWRDSGDDVRARAVLTNLCDAGEAAGWSVVLAASGATDLMSELGRTPLSQNKSASKVAARRAPSAGTAR
jgi:hypothetical protein